MQTKIYHKVYLRLLAEISDILEVHTICAPDDLDSWVLIEAPLLDKQLLSFLEGKVHTITCPEWFKPLLDKAMEMTPTPGYLYPDRLRLIRQLLVFCYKIEFEPTKEQLNETIKSFIEVDTTVGLYDEAGLIAQHSQSDRLGCFKTAQTLISRVTAKCNFRDIVPNHGPGAVFPSRKPWLKSMFTTCYNSIDRYYPWSEFFQIGLMTGLYDPLQDNTQLGETITASLIAVPKDSRGPRLICVHPAEAIWIQQGQRVVLETAITKSNVVNGQIAFDDQTINGSKALLSSSTRSLATLDLKEASDRISCGLVKYLFKEEQYNILSCTRASQVRLPDGRVHMLRKWAPMGNCLTFPVESLIFWSLVQAAIISVTGRKSSDVYVFGDDIIFPSEHYDVVIKCLVGAGLVPNAAKTFRHGFFRESCGVDAFFGTDITPLRLRKSDILSIQDAESYCDLAKRLNAKGLKHTASHIYALIGQKHGTLPLSNNPNASGLVEYRDIPKSYFILRALLGDPNYRFNKKLQRYEVRHKRTVQASYRLTACYRNNILDSLVQLERRNPQKFLSDRGLGYVVPYTQRSIYGWSELH